MLPSAAPAALPANPNQDQRRAIIEDWLISGMPSDVADLEARKVWGLSRHVVQEDLKAIKAAWAEQARNEDPVEVWRESLRLREMLLERTLRLMSGMKDGDPAAGRVYKLCYGIVKERDRIVRTIDKLVRSRQARTPRQPKPAPQPGSIDFAGLTCSLAKALAPKRRRAKRRA